MLPTFCLCDVNCQGLNKKKKSSKTFFCCIYFAWFDDAPIWLIHSLNSLSHHCPSHTNKTTLHVQCVFTAMLTLSFNFCGEPMTSQVTKINMQRFQKKKTTWFDFGKDDFVYMIWWLNYICKIWDTCRNKLTLTLGFTWDINDSVKTEVPAVTHHRLDLIVLLLHLRLLWYLNRFSTGLNGNNCFVSHMQNWTWNKMHAI